MENAIAADAQQLQAGTAVDCYGIFPANVLWDAAVLTSQM
jgi:hypothetical protein